MARRILQVIERGSYAYVAASAAGICEKTFYTWLEKGRDAKSGPYLQFLQDIKKAEALGEIRAMDEWQTLGAEDWKARATFLERRYPGRWGRRDAVEHSGPGGGPIAITKPDPRDFEDPQVRALYDQVAARIAEIRRKAIEAGQTIDAEAEPIPEAKPEPVP